MKPIRIVCGTRQSREDFPTKTALGRSLQIHQDSNPVELVLFAENKEGLSTLYNRAIEQAKEHPAILVFVHDDVHLCDYWWGERLREGVDAFDVVGLAGNTRRVTGQPAWAFIDDKFTWDQPCYLSGAVGHGSSYPCVVSNFGPAPQPCKLLDGLLLAADSERLVQADVRFDEQFEFHFYDMDFCRQAEAKGLRMGTWPLSVVHESAGAFGTPVWRESYRRYLCKYDEQLDQSAQEKSVQSQLPVQHSYNPDLLKLMPVNAKRVIEVGCSSGALAHEYRKLNPQVHYTGIEIDPGCAQQAREHCDRVLDMNIETASADLLATDLSADCWVFGDVLEHLYDPWQLLNTIREASKPGTCVVACISNAQHWSVQARLSIGDFRYEDSGVFDRGRIRWFTLATMLEMFTQAGLAVESGVPRVFEEPQREHFLPAIRAMAAAAGKDPELAVQDALPLQYVIRAVVG